LTFITLDTEIFDSVKWLVKICHSSAVIAQAKRFYCILMHSGKLLWFILKVFWQIIKGTSGILNVVLVRGPVVHMNDAFW